MSGQHQTIDGLLRESRARLDRVTPERASAAMDQGALLIDIRSESQRASDGVVPGSLFVARNVLEWRLDPHGERRIPGFTEDTTVIVFCNEGYSSSLAARDLRALGLRHATDLIGGFRAWRAAGLPIRAGATPAVT